jgi:hypothetical protein
MVGKQNSNLIKIDIPPAYLHITAGYKNRGKLFKRYVDGYIERSYPELRLIRIEGMKALCERKEV